MLPVRIPFFGGANITVGASAPIFGLLGALVYYGKRTGSSHIGQAGLQYALIVGVMGFILPGIDNTAHLGGFAGGYLASLILDPLKPERIDHLAIAVGLPARDLHRDHLVGDHGAAATLPETPGSRCLRDTPIWIRLHVIEGAGRPETHTVGRTRDERHARL